MLERFQGRKEALKKKAGKILRVAVGAAMLSSVGCGTEKTSTPEQTRVLQEFKLENSFPVDGATFNPEARGNVEANVKKFLQSHNSSEAFDDLLRSRVIIEGSSDERPTKAWGERGNEALSENRLVAIDNLIHAIVNNFEYSKDIKESDVARFKSKTYIKRMPGGAWGKGFIPLTELTNPKTGKKYTQAEISALSLQEKTKLYDSTRYTNVNFEIPGKNERDIQYEKLIDIIDSYDVVTLMLDRSNSMADDYSLFADKITAQLSKADNDLLQDTAAIVTFEHNADQGTNQIPVAKLPEELKNMRTFGSDERITTSLAQVMDRVGKVEGNRHQAIIALTDEGIQDFSITSLNEIIAKSGHNKCDVYFGLLAKDGLISFMDAQGLAYDAKYFAESFLTEKLFFPADTKDDEKLKFIMDNIVRVDVTDDGSLSFRLSVKGYRELKNNVNSNFRDLRKNLNEQFSASLEALKKEYNEKIAAEPLHDKKYTLSQEYSDKRDKLITDSTDKIHTAEQQSMDAMVYLDKLISS